MTDGDARAEFRARFGELLRYSGLPQYRLAQKAETVLRMAVTVSAAPTRPGCCDVTSRQRRA